MLEADGVLRTWAIESLPRDWVERLNKDPAHAAATEPIAAERLADHRLAYLDYEGKISAGRGAVARWLRGTFEWIVNDDDRVIIRLAAPLSGELTLARAPATATQWRLTWSSSG